MNHPTPFPPSFHQELVKKKRHNKKKKKPTNKSKASDTTVVSLPSPPIPPSHQPKKKRPFPHPPSPSPHPPQGQAHNNNNNNNNNKRPRTSPSSSSSSSALPSYPYPVDYCDHFETPSQAYQDIEPWLSYLATMNNKKEAKSSSATTTSSSKKTDLCIYDPYFCVGTMKKILAGLGFPKVINRMSDFYADQKQGKVPEYDVLITNPPYSETHKEKILQYCLASEKPWALLMPSYVANKAYYQEAINKLPEEARPFYIVPTNKYEYTHPEGTGHATSPFFSMWFCHLGKGKMHASASKACFAWLENKASTTKGGGAGGGMKSWRLVRTVEGLRSTGAVPSWKRPNNKRRKKLKMAAAAKAAGGGGGGGGGR